MDSKCNEISKRRNEYRIWQKDISLSNLNISINHNFYENFIVLILMGWLNVLRRQEGAKEEEFDTNLLNRNNLHTLSGEGMQVPSGIQRQNAFNCN